MSKTFGLQPEEVELLEERQIFQRQSRLAMPVKKNEMGRMAIQGSRGSREISVLRFSFMANFNHGRVS
ncbi:MAG: hypothetical protein HN867_11895 [Deltaproteobacteria bacterium]|nr:hypothetical protein [Deltaproteobacteria bacterium]